MQVAMIDQQMLIWGMLIRTEGSRQNWMMQESDSELREIKELVGKRSEESGE